MSTDFSILRRLKAFLGDRRGVAAVEFALILPFLMLLYLGSVEASFSVAVHKKMEETGATISDLIARETVVDPAKLDDIFKISASSMYPYPVENLDVLVIGVKNPSKGNIQLKWLRSKSGKIKFFPISEIPKSAFDVKDNFFVVVQTTYDYKPLSGVTGTAFTMQGLAISRARLTKDLACNGC